MDALDAKLMSEQTTLCILKALFAPIRRLPLEILGIIIRTHVLEHKQSIWTPMHVCRAWRSAALLVTDLWSESEIVRTKRWEPAQLHLCATKEDLLFALEYAVNKPLDLELSPSAQIGQVIDLFRILNDAMPHPRIRFLKIKNHNISSTPDGLTDPWDLSELRVALTRDSSLVKRATKESQVLQTLESRCNVLSKSTPPSVWPRLRELQFHGQLSPAMYSILDKCTPLTVLCIGRYVRGQGATADLFYQQPHISMRQLRTLTLQGSMPLWPIECKNIESVTMNFVEACNIPLRNGLIGLPRLTFLRTDLFSLLPLFDAPKVQTLSIEDVVSPRDDAANVLDAILPKERVSEEKDLADTRSPVNPLQTDLACLCIPPEQLANLLFRLFRALSQCKFQSLASIRGSLIIYFPRPHP